MNFSALILVSCITQLLVILGTLFLLVALATVARPKARKFFECVKTQAVALEFTWFVSIVTFWISVLFYTAGANGHRFSLYCGTAMLIIVAFMYLGLSSMVHRLRTQIWNKHTENLDVSISEIMYMLKIYSDNLMEKGRTKNRSEQGGEVHLSISHFRNFVLAVERRQRSTGDWLAVRAITMNNFTRIRVDRLWAALEDKIIALGYASDTHNDWLYSGDNGLKVDRALAELAQVLFDFRSHKRLTAFQATASGRERSVTRIQSQGRATSQSTRLTSTGMVSADQVATLLASKAKKGQRASVADGATSSDNPEGLAEDVHDREAAEQVLGTELKGWAYLRTISWRIVTSTWAVKQFIYVDRDELYGRLKNYFETRAVVTAMLLAISSEMYYQGQPNGGVLTVVDWDRIVAPWDTYINVYNFSALILLCCLLELMVLFGCMFILAGLTTIPMGKARKFLEAIRIAVGVMEASWSFSIFLLVVCVLYYTAATQGMTFVAYCSVIAVPIFLMMAVGLSSMVHRLHRYIWTKDDELFDLTTSDLLVLLDQYVENVISTATKTHGDVDLAFETFVSYCLIIARKEKDLAMTHWLGRHGASLNNTTRERIRRLLGHLDHKILQMEFAYKVDNGKDEANAALNSLATRIFRFRNGRHRSMFQGTSQRNRKRSMMEKLNIWRGPSSQGTALVPVLPAR